MIRLLASLAFVAACAHAPRPALQPINQTGALSLSVRAGDQLVEIGLVARGNHTKLVRIVGHDFVELFDPPTQIPGVPSTVHAFDYMIDPGPAVEGETNIPGRFTLVASGNAGQIVYRTTWVFTWNPARKAFEISERYTQREDVSRCLVCDSES